jgi:hypothetical protein
MVFVNQTDGLSHTVQGSKTEMKPRVLISTTATTIVVTILTIVIGTLIALPWWSKTWEKTLINLKREPDVLGAVLGYICDSTHLMAMFEGQNFTSMAQLEAFFKASNRRFRIGKFIGNDGILYYGIEVEDETNWVEGGSDEEGEEITSLTPARSASSAASAPPAPLALAAPTSP